MPAQVEPHQCLFLRSSSGLFFRPRSTARGFACHRSVIGSHTFRCDDGERCN